MSDLISLLFETNAFKICEENKPFWYTSGKIGPYFINADFLYGSEKASKELLEFINQKLETTDKENIPYFVFEKILDQYENNKIFKCVIDSIVEYIKENIDTDIIDYISGGERRDWYFSILVSYLLGKPHITIFKDLTTIVSTCDFEESTLVTKLENKKILHIADLLNQSSSYTRSWIPAIKNLGSNMTWSIVIVDRLQGGTNILSDMGIQTFSLINIDDDLFLKAFELEIINNIQLEMLREFKKDPDGSMRNFLLMHPEFLENSLKSEDSKTLKRVNDCIERNIYYQ